MKKEYKREYTILRDFKELYNSIPKLYKKEACLFMGYSRTNYFTNKQRTNPREYALLKEFIEILKDRERTKCSYVPFNHIIVLDHYRELCNYINSETFKRLNLNDQDKLRVEKQRLKIELYLEKKITSNYQNKFAH